MTKIFDFGVHDIYHRPGEMREIEREVTLPETFGEGLAAVTAGTKVNLHVRLESVHEGILATVRAVTTVAAECSRCLLEFNETLEVDFIELFAYNPTETEEYGVHGDHVNLEPPLRDAVVLALPFTPVCREDCYGLDPVTGERLHRAAADTAEAVDPRWAVLAGFSVEDNNAEAKA